ncbi:MAG: hypothetical protein ACFFC7_32970 [Candidatus Hermodarchaeota archaeon]
MLCVLIVFILSTCATVGSLSEEEKEAMQTATFDASYTQTFNAVVDVLEDAGWFIGNVDREVGIITTDWLEGPISFEEELFLGSGIRRKMSANIDALEEEKTKVKLRYMTQTLDTDGGCLGGGGWRGTEDEVSVDDARKAYKKYFDAILAEISE